MVVQFPVRRRVHSGYVMEDIIKKVGIFSAPTPQGEDGGNSSVSKVLMYDDGMTL